MVAMGIACDAPAMVTQIPAAINNDFITSSQ
jgi:hypothetical protein